MKPEAQNIVLGAGYIYFAKEDSDGNLLGERYLGDTPGFSLSVNTENLQVYSSDGPVAQLLEDITTQVTREGTVTVQNIVLPNLAAFLVGDETTIDQTGDTVTGEEISNVFPGHWYQLGETEDDLRGVRNVSDVSVTLDPEGENTSLTEGEDFEVDKETGRIYILPDGDVSEGDTIGVDYDKEEVSWDSVESNQLGPATGKLRFVAHNTAGRNRDLLIPRVQMAPSGSASFKSREDQMQLEFTLRVSKRGSMAQVYLDNRPA